MGRNPHSQSRRVAQFVQAVSIGVMVIAMLALAGWWLDNPLLESGLPGYVSVKANTAIGLLTSALGLWLLADSRSAASWRQWTPRAAGLVAVALGAASLTEYLLGTSPGIDEWLFVEPPGAPYTSSPGRMSPLTAIAFVLLGTGLWRTGRSRAQLPAVAGLLTTVIGAIHLIGYMYSAEPLYQIGPFTRMAVPTAAAFTALGVGVLALQPDAWLKRILTSGTAGGWVARWLLPPVLVLPVVFEWLALQAERAGLFDNATVAAFTATAAMVSLAGGVFAVARVLERRDRERQRFDELLREANGRLAKAAGEAHFRQMVDDAIVGIYRTTPDGTVQLANRALAEMLGYASVEELAGRKLDEGVFGTHSSRQRLLTALMEQGQIRGQESEWIRTDGTPIVVRENARAIRDAQGRVLSFEGTVENVTERARAEKSERRLLDILHVTPDLVSIADLDGRLLYLNDAGRAMLGLTQSTELGHNLRQFHPATYADFLDSDAIPTACRDGAWRGETEVLALDGRVIFASQVILAHKAPDGSVVCLSTVIRDITAEKRAEKSLSESLRSANTAARRLDVLAQNLPLVLWEGRARGNGLEMTWVSSNAEVILGVPPDMLVGTSAWLSHVHPDDRRGAGTIPAPALMRGAPTQTWGEEYRWVRADGAIIHLQAGVSAVREADDSCHLVGFVLDISERVEVWRALRESERLLGISQEVGNLGTYALDLSTDRWTSSPVLDRIFGIDAHYERSLDGWKRLISSEWQDRMVTYFKDVVIAGGRPFDMEYPIVRHEDGQVRWVHGLGGIEYDDSGQPLRLVGTISDSTARRRIETALRLQAAALYAAANAVVITDIAGVIEWVNPAFTSLTGYTADEALGRNPRDLVKSGKHDQAFYKALWDTVLGGSTWEGTIINRRKDGTEYTEHQTITPILDAAGAITHFVAIKDDMSERLKLEAQFRQVQRLESVGQLASGIAHDFNNLLTVINGTAELLLRHTTPADPAHAELQEILQAGERAASLTRQLLAFSRQQILAPRVLNVNEVLAGLEVLLRRLLGEDIELAILASPDLEPVRADAGQLEQVLTNLAVNARDAMPLGGRLTIETRNVTINRDDLSQRDVQGQSGPYVMIAVSDSGIGMDEVTRSRIFEPFFTTKGPGKGTGLGLSTVYGIVKQSGGFIWVYSEVGAGTRFTIYLPIVSGIVDHDQPRPAAESPRGTETVLIVEDTAALRTLARRFLTAAGYTVMTAADGAEALQLARQYEGTIHMVLTDVVMPGSSGRDVAERLVSARPHMKVLYMSGYTSDTVVRHGILDAQMAFLNKPFNSASLLGKVREVLDS